MQVKWITKAQQQNNKPKPNEGDYVNIHYIAYLEDGRIFDSSRDRQQDYQFQLGDPTVVKAWNQLVRQMCVGDRVQALITDPALAFGVKGIGGVVKPNAQVKFDIQLLQIR